MSTSKNQNSRQAAKEIADKLGETEKKPRRQIESIVEHCGLEFAQQLLADTLETEANGGMLVNSGTRRRTLGGIYFYLARERMSEELRQEIFYAWRVVAKNRVEREAQFPEFEWDARAELLQSLLQESGDIKEVNIHLVGRPGEIERRQNLVVTTMEYTFDPELVLPVGVPQPPTVKQVYTVYVSAKQWERVEEAINHPDDDLLIDGFCAYDDDIEAMTVYATYITTRRLKRKDRKQSKQAPSGAAGKQSARGGSSGGGGSKPNGTEKRPARGRERDTHKLPEKEATVIELNLPDSVPADVVQKLTDLHTAAESFRQKINTLEAKPAGQQFGLEMTQKLLRNTEKQIESLEKKYVNS